MCNKIRNTTPHTQFLSDFNQINVMINMVVMKEDRLLDLFCLKCATYRKIRMAFRFFSYHRSMQSEKIQTILYTVEPVLRDNCHERPPVLKDQIFLAEGPIFSIQLNLSPKTTCLEKPHFHGQWGGLSRQVLLYMYLHGL